MNEKSQVENRSRHDRTPVIVFAGFRCYQSNNGIFRPFKSGYYNQAYGFHDCFHSGTLFL